MRRRSAAYWRQTQHKSRRSRGVRLESLEDRAVPSGLSVSLADRQILEGQVTTGTVTRNTADVSLPLNVVLHSSDITAATVPPSVVIPAGQISATFPVVGVDDPYLDGTQPVVITAEASLPPTFDQQNPSLMAYNTQTMATLPDGRYVTAGLRYIGPGPNAYDVAVSRFLSNGLSDQSFGSGGTVYTPIAAGSYDAPTVILPQSDGKILVAGNTAPEFTPYKTTMFVLRYNTNGTLDTTFGVGGKVVLDFGPNTLAEVHDLTFGASGTIYLAGMLDRFDGSFGDFAVVRLTATGAMDPTWGGSGVVTTGFQDRDTIYEAVPQTDGKLVVAGQAGGNGPTSLLALARYNTNGTLDATFGTGGKVTVDLPGTEEGLTDFIFSFGKILAVGQVRPTGATPDNPHDWVIAQFNPNGAIEPSFGNGGFITYDIGGDDQAQSLVQMSDGTFTVGGYGAGTVAGSSRRPIAAQFSPDGRSMLMSLVVPRPDAVGLDLVYQNSTLRLAGTSSYWAGGFVENLVPGSGGFTTASDGLSVLDNEEGPSVQPDAYDALEDTTLYASNYPPT
ncbi:MAG TPA: hypothetical protein VKE40_03415, partial [Gemmataceae bacterium]|nr:hypothetical protein [Gemmataceae bacterium]